MTKHCRKSSHSQTNKNLWVIWRKIIEVVYATYAVAKRKYCTWLPFRNCISRVYNCNDLPSNNSSLRGWNKWFSYIHNSYLPTSGDLKSGDSLFCTTPPLPPPNVNSTNTPRLPARQQIALGHYMTSYMNDMESKCTFIIVMTN